MTTSHRQVRITFSTQNKQGKKKTVTGRIVTVLRANRKYSTKYLDSLGITDYVQNTSTRCRMVLKTLDKKILIIDISPSIIRNSNIIRFQP